MTIDDSYFGRARNEMRRFLPGRCGKVLEIGCGEGYFSAGIVGAEERWGIEPDSDAARAARSHLDRVINAGFEEALAELPPDHFDTVVCNDVIEHMPDHDRFLETIKTRMSPRGVLVGSIPNVRYYRNLFGLMLAKDWQYQDAGILDRTHLRFFTKKSLRRTLLAHGFRIDAMRGINGGLTRRAPLAGAIAFAAIVLSAGYFADIWHLQFAFRALIADPEPAGEANSGTANRMVAC